MCGEAGAAVLNEEHADCDPVNEGAHGLGKKLPQHPSSHSGEVKPMGSL